MAHSCGQEDVSTASFTARTVREKGGKASYLMRSMYFLYEIPERVGGV